jgi:hypothetical protein
MTFHTVVFFLTKNWGFLNTRIKNDSLLTHLIISTSTISDLKIVTHKVLDQAHVTIRQRLVNRQHVSNSLEISGQTSSSEDKKTSERNWWTKFLLWQRWEFSPLKLVPLLLSCSKNFYQYHVHTSLYTGFSSLHLRTNFYEGAKA